MSMECFEPDTDFTCIHFDCPSCHQIFEHEHDTALRGCTPSEPDGEMLCSSCELDREEAEADGAE